MRKIKDPEIKSIERVVGTKIAKEELQKQAGNKADEKSSNALTQSLPKALKILEVLSDNPNGIPFGHIVEQTGLNKSTAYRMLQTMQSLGYVEAGSQSGSYRASFKIVALGQKLIHGTNIIQLALPELTALNESIGETLNLKVFHGDHSVILLKLEPKIGQVRTHAYMGMSVPLYLSATGKVFLAYRTKAFVSEYWHNKQSEIQKITPFTITDLATFSERLEFVRENGYALDLGENEYGFSCIAAPIFDYMGNVDHAVSITMPTAKLQMSSIETFVKPLLKTLRSISKSLGYEAFNAKEKGE